MEYLIGSAILLVMVLLVFAATVGSPTRHLRALRNYAYVLSFAIATAVTGADPVGLLGLFLPAVTLYEATVLVTG